MQQLFFKYSLRITGIIVFLLACIPGFAQDKIEIDKEEIGSWFERNWIWVVGGLVLIILIAALSRVRTRNRGGTIAGGTKSTTTVVKDASGNTKSVTTTEENL